ncbi:lysosomal-trafficking regulator isoform X2 [Armigeres subalbatus]|uniref:lysosomal-trafficking regulator isoform X2 n=1 Tax=Armigeres subalbatus TaxID=124917 RepID=UPI002ED297C4
MALESMPYARIGILWKNYLNASNEDDRGPDDDDNNDDIGSSTIVGGSKTAWLEVFLYEFGKLSEERRTYFQQSNISETISSVLSRQLLLFIYEICDSSKGIPEEQTLRKRASSITSSLSSASTYMTARSGTTDCTNGTAADDTNQVLLDGSTAALLLPPNTDHQQYDNKIDSDPLNNDPGEDRCTVLREFLLEGIGGRILRVLDQIGAKDIVNSREFTDVLIQILPTRKKWITQQTELEYSVQYNWQLLKVLKMRTGNSDWRNGVKRNSMNLSSSQIIECTSPVQVSSPPAICRMLSCPPVAQEHKVAQTHPDPPQPTNLADYHTEAFKAHIHNPLSQDRLTMIVLNLLESLVIHENIFMIDEKSVTISCLRMAVERLRRQEVLEENSRNRLILRHKLLGILMLSLNNLFFLDSLESDRVSLKQITSEVMELLRKELDVGSINPISCDFVYNLTYTIVSTVNQSFLHYCEHLVSEHFFQAIFRLLESNLDIVKHVYSLLQETNGINGTHQSVIHILLKMLQNFILVLAPNRSTGKKPPRARHRLHHARQDPKTAHICALENILLNIFPVVKYSDQRTLLHFFGENQICCCNATMETLEAILIITNDDLVPRICLNFANRSVIGAIFSRSSCTRCESERRSDHFNERFDRVHRRVFEAFARAENRPRMPILLKYLQDVVKVVPPSLGKSVLFELVLPQLIKERTEFTTNTLDDTTKDLVNGCLSIVARCLKNTDLLEIFFTDKNIELLSDLSKRAEFVYHVGVIFRIAFDASDFQNIMHDQLGNIIMSNLKALSDYLGSLFAILKTSDIHIRLKGPAEKFENDLSSEQSTNNVLQVFAEHWKIVRYLIQVNDHFYNTFCKTFGECEELLCLVCNMFSAVIYQYKPNQSETPPTKLSADELSEQTNLERRSILNIFHFNDELIDHQLPSDEFFYYSCSSTASDGIEDEDYSLLRELTNQKMLPFPSASQEQLNNGKLERTWSLFEKLNIRQLLTELVDEYFPRNAKQRAPFSDLPEQARQLLSTGGFIRKRLAMLVELILSTFQLLVAKDNRLEDAMQSALIELKKLLLSGALENWDSPEVTKNVMNALQSLLKIAEVRGEVAGFEIIDGAQTNEYYFPVQSFSGVGRKSVSAEDDISSTDESYTTAFDDGYDGDVENDQLLTVASRRNSSMRSREVGSTKINQNICNIVIDILVELSKKCATDPQSWCPTLSQMILKLNGIKDHLGGSLYLITGFGPVLERSDVRLKELQTSILELITDLDTPEVFSKFLQLLTLDDPPVQLILTKLMNIVDTTFKLECYTEISFPDKGDDGSRISTCDALLSKKINYLREHHKFYNIRSPFTCSAKMIPLSYVNFSPWNTEGFTASVWFRLSATQQDSNRLAITHLISVGSEKQIISVFINRQRQFTVRFNKPDRIITSANTKRYLASAIDVSCCDNCAKELSHMWSYKNFLRSIEPSVQAFRIDTPGAQCVYCYKHLPATTKKVATSSLSNDYFYDLHSEQYSIKELQLVEDQWTSLALSVQQVDNSISIVLTLDGVQQQHLTIVEPCQIHIDTALPVLAIGHRIGIEDDCPLSYSLSNVQLFRKCFTDVSTLANLYSLGPNWIHLSGFLKGEIVPNYGNLNLSKLSLEDLHPRNHFQLLHRSHIGNFAAHKPDVFVTGKPGYGRVALGMLSFSPRIAPVENLSLQRSIQLSGGITAMLFAFARIVELSDSARIHANALNLLLRIAHDNNDFYNEFVQRDLLELVGIVLKNKKCHKEVCVLAAILQVTFDQPVLVYRGDTYSVLTNSVARIRYPEIIVFFFENFQIWIDHSEEVLNLVFKIMITITRDKHPGMEYNCKRLADAGLVPTLIDFCRMNFVIPPKTVKISETAADWLVTLIKNLSSTPPKVSLLKEIIDLLLLMHKPTDSYVTHDRQKFYFNINPQLPIRATKPNENKLSQRLNLRERRLKYSQLRKVIPLAIANTNNASFESTTSFIEMGKLESKRADSLETSPQATPKSSQGSPTAENYQANYEKLNHALADVNIRRRSLKSEKRKVRRLQSPTARVCSTPKERTSPSKAAARKELNMSTQSLPTKFKFFEQNYFGTGNDFIQESFLRAMCDLLLILPDQEARQFFSAENKIIETLLILANNSNIRIRTRIISLIAVISDRVLSSYTEEQFKIFWHHLGNQIGSHSVNIDLLNSCFRWITKTGSVLSLESLIFEYHVNIVQECGLNVLMATLPQSHTDPRLFQLILHLILYIELKNQKATQYMVDNGLVGTLVKTAVKMHEKDEAGEVISNRDCFLSFITTFAQRSLASVNFVIPFWDLINGLILAERHKNPKVTLGVRDIQALFYRNLLQLFIYRPTDSIIGHKNNSFTVDLPGCTIAKAEIKARYNQIHDKAVQFITNCDADHQVSESEILLIKSLMNRTLNGNPRGGNIILWCLMPKRPISLKLYTIRQLGQYIDGGNYLSLICDVRMLKVFSHSILLLNQKDLSVEDWAVVNSFYKSIEGPNNITWSLTQTLEEFDYLRTININDQEQTILKSINKQEKLIHTCTIAAMEITRNIVEKQNKLRKELIIQLKKDNDFKFFNQWRQIIEQMTHEDAPWYNEKLYPASWELDDTYGPSLTLTRMKRCRQTVAERFLQKDFRTAEDQPSKPLLEYLIPHNRSQEFSMENQVLYTWTVRQISPKDERDSECILTSTELVLSLSTGDISIYDLYDITKIWKKRYQHQETAVEIFLRSDRSLFLVFDRSLEREQFVGFFHDLVQREGRQELDAHTQAWREGSLSNWEYLMHLNQISGRSYHDLMQYPVLPWILADYESQTLDLQLEKVFRNLEKPIAVQYKDLEKHYINNYNYLKQSENDSLSRQRIQPYHYSSHYSNSGTVLHFLVRMLPFTSLFLQYQDNSFDIPDRTFHSLATTWKLASRDSPTDVKELIPEFYCCPEFMENCEGFDFGLRQSGEPVNHVELPPWCHQSTRLFILIHRQALESDHVRKRISSWIDLIFGYKQTGSAAVEAINVFHPATYANFNATDIDDPVEKLALETMVKTYGQMPRQLFDSPHPQSNHAPLWANPPEVVDTVSGLKWGLYCGSPVLPSPKIVDIRGTVNSPSSLTQIEGNKVVALPLRMNIFRGQHTKAQYLMDWGHLDDVVRFRSVQDSDTRSSELVYNTNMDPITACGSDPNCPDIWFGHQSGRIAVFQQRQAKKMSFFNSNIQPSVTRKRSSSFRKWIDRKSATLRRRLEGDDDGEEGTGSVPIKWNFPIILIKHRAEITAISISIEFKIVVSVSMDGTAAIWDYNTLSYVREIPKPVNGINSKISLVAISPTMGDIVTIYSSTRASSVSGRSNDTSTLVDDESFEVTENYNMDYVNVAMASSRDQLRLHTINAKYVEHVFMESPVMAVCYSSVKEGCGVNCIAVGMENGVIRLYSSWNLAMVREIASNMGDLFGITSLIYSKNQHLIVLLSSNMIQTWKSEGLPGISPQITELPIRRSIG